jgi:hypothetical protein
VDTTGREETEMGWEVANEGRIADSPCFCLCVVQMARLYYFNHTLSPEEFQTLANDTPAALRYATMPLITDIRPPYMLPFNNSVYIVSVLLPQLWGNNVSLQIITVPPNLAQPSQLDWDPHAAGLNLPQSFSIRLQTLADMDATQFSVSYVLLGDTKNYSVPIPSSYTVLRFDMTSFMSTALLTLNTSAVPTPNSGTVTFSPKPSVPSGWLTFNGLWQGLDISDGVLADTGPLITPSRGPGQTTAIPSPVQWLPNEMGQPTGNGWSIDGWFFLESYQHMHTILECADTATNDKITVSLSSTTRYYQYQHFLSTYVAGSIGCLCSSSLATTTYTPPQTPLYGWHHWGFSSQYGDTQARICCYCGQVADVFSCIFPLCTVDSSSRIRFLFDGVFQGLSSCYFPRSIQRSTCSIGRRNDGNNQNNHFLMGKIASWNMWERVLHDLEMVQLANVLVPQADIFHTRPWNAPPLLQVGTTQQVDLYTPLPMGNVSVFVTASVPGVLTSNPLQVYFPLNSFAPQSFQIKMPPGVKGFNLTFQTCCDPRYYAPLPMYIGNFTLPALYALATVVTNMSRPSENARWQKSINNKPGNGLAVFPPPSAIVPLTYLNLNKTSDTLQAGTRGALDPYMQSRVDGWTVSEGRHACKVHHASCDEFCTVAHSFSLLALSRSTAGS